MPTKQRLARTTKIARESRGTFANRNRTTWFTVPLLLFHEFLWPKLFVDAELDRLLVLARRRMSATASTTRAAPTTLPKASSIVLALNFPPFPGSECKFRHSELGQPGHEDDSSLV